RHFFDTADLKALPFFDHLDELSGLHQRGKRAGVQPRRTPTENAHFEAPSGEVRFVDVRNFVFATGGRLDAFGNLHHSVVVEIQARHGKIRLRVLWFFLDGDHIVLRVKLDDAVSLGVGYLIGEDHAARGLRAFLQHACDAIAIEVYVAQDYRYDVSDDQG